MDKVKKLFKSKTTSIFLILVAMCILLGILNPNFFKYENLLSVSGVAAYTAIFAFGEMIVILQQGIELSVGSMIGLTSVISCLLITKTNLPLAATIPMTLLVGAFCGAINAALVIFVHLDPYIATMGMSQVLQSVGLLITDARPVMGTGDAYINIGKGTFLKVPICVWIALVVAIILGIILRFTVTGRRAYAVGGNPEAAKFSGINVNAMRFGGYVLAGFLNALSAIIISAKLGAAQGSTGHGYESDAIASAVIGGTAFSGGSGTVFGTIVGACIMAVIRNGLVLLSVSTYLQSMIIGLIIIVAVAIDKFQQIRSQKVAKQFIQEAIESQEKAQ